MLEKILEGSQTFKQSVHTQYDKKNQYCTNEFMGVCCCYSQYCSAQLHCIIVMVQVIASDTSNVYLCHICVHLNVFGGRFTPYIACHLSCSKDVLAKHPHHFLLFPFPAGSASLVTQICDLYISRTTQHPRGRICTLSEI